MRNALLPSSSRQARTEVEFPTPGVYSTTTLEVLKKLPDPDSKNILSNGPYSWFFVADCWLTWNKVLLAFVNFDSALDQVQKIPD